VAGATCASVIRTAAAEMQAAPMATSTADRDRAAVGLSPLAIGSRWRQKTAMGLTGDPVPP
jgi:hypothetical protein